ncbi:hypothetical protein ACSFA8_22145 [Variovorax sp. RT4R15]|uniref:hypothetical protein n=1 Tax=Variovorax sp. RT4R15 TaxID=3443737 RepID=UPI003F4561C4
MSEAIFCFDTASVRFAIYPPGAAGATRVIVEIGEDPLRDHFGATGGGESLLEAYQLHSDEIGEKAMVRYLAAPHKPVFLTSADFDWIDQVEEILHLAQTTALQATGQQQQLREPAHA